MYAMHGACMTTREAHKSECYAIDIYGYGQLIKLLTNILRFDELFENSQAKNVWENKRKVLRTGQ
jgi:hypothetical protein